MTQEQLKQLRELLNLADKALPGNNYFRVAEIASNLYLVGVSEGIDGDNLTQYLTPDGTVSDWCN